MDERELAALVEKARERLMSHTPEPVSQRDVLNRTEVEALVFLALVGALGGIVSLSPHFFGVEVPSNPSFLLTVPALWFVWYVWSERNMPMGNPRPRERPLDKHAPATIVAKTYCATFSSWDEHRELWLVMRQIWIEGEARAFDYLTDPKQEALEHPDAVQDSSGKDSTDGSTEKPSV